MFRTQQEPYQKGRLGVLDLIMGCYCGIRGVMSNFRHTYEPSSTVNLLPSPQNTPPFVPPIFVSTLFFFPEYSFPPSWLEKKMPIPPSSGSVHISSVSLASTALQPPFWGGAFLHCHSSLGKSVPSSAPLTDAARSHQEALQGTQSLLPLPVSL